MHQSIVTAISEALAVRNNAASFSLSLQRRVKTMEGLLAPEGLTGPERLALQALQARLTEAVKVLGNYRARLSEQIALIDPAVPPAPDEADLLRSELLAAIDREHDRRRAATYSPEQELQIHANRVALLGHLFGIIEGTFPTPTLEERTALAARWADLSTLDALATTSASKRVEVLSLAANELKDYDVTTGWPT